MVMPFANVTSACAWLEARRDDEAWDQSCMQGADVPHGVPHLCRSGARHYFLPDGCHVRPRRVPLTHEWHEHRHALLVGAGPLFAKKLAHEKLLLDARLDEQTARNEGGPKNLHRYMCVLKRHLIKKSPI